MIASDGWDGGVVGAHRIAALALDLVASQDVGSLALMSWRQDRNSASQPSRSATKIVSASPYLVLKIKGYSKSLNTVCDQPCFDSSPFRAGGRTWHVSYRPKGSPGFPENAEYISFYLYLDDVIQVPVIATVNFSLLNQNNEAVQYFCPTSITHHDFTVGTRGFGYEKFMRREELEESGHLKDDCFELRVQIFIVKETPSSIGVPPSSIQRHMSNLLLTGHRADVEFRVGEETFVAHRLVLGARSPVFNAELHGPMKEGDGKNILQIDDMEAQVFWAMLAFIYTDAWPDMEQEDEPVMAQHLLVSADRYRLQRLKLLCEEKLHDHIDDNSVAIILALAEKHHCCGLKERCLEFLRSSTTSLTLVQAEEFKYLTRSCPSIVNELITSCNRNLREVTMAVLVVLASSSEPKPQGDCGGTRP
ncbi:hypothetical protein PR202_gb14097 [Eleusine coracana subsp. coracana]|uniref:Uncharacterized protein n=1 Tax=Eleusine coracana subsp. coracana TaxID=191504 RepID=A0AAV5EUC9_ELECO|nr:hypothetical protein PR202_gb14097 [Eleusine coracana subsp. coracana]